MADMASGARRARDPLAGKKAALKIVAVCLAITVVCYTVYEIYAVNKTTITTKTAYEQTVYDTLDMKIFVVRDEHLLNVPSGNAVVSLSENGERVSRNAAIAAVFSSPENASKYVEAKKLRKELERCDTLTSQAAYSGLKVLSLRDQIRTDFCGILNGVYSGDMATAFEKANDFRNNATTLDIVTGGTLDIAKKKETLSQQIIALESSMGEYSTVHTEINQAGFFIGSSDGCEQLLSYTDVTSLTAAQVTSAVEQSKSASPRDKTGRLVCSYNWYIAAAMPSKSVSSLKVGDTVTIRLPHCEPASINATVCAKNDGSDSSTALIFECSLINEDLLSLRCEDAQLVMDSFTGYRVETPSIRVLETESGTVKGVYILRGNIVNFRKIAEIYSGEGYVLSDSSAGGGYIQLYDEIVLTGKGLENGAVVD